MGCTASTSTTAQDTTRPSVKPDNGASATGVAGESGADETKTLPDEAVEEDAPQPVAASVEPAAAAGEAPSETPAAGEAPSEAPAAGEALSEAPAAGEAPSEAPAAPTDDVQPLDAAEATEATAVSPEPAAADTNQGESTDATTEATPEATPEAE